MRDPDADLLGRIGAGDSRAVRVLLDRRLPAIVALARRMLGDAAEAEDVAQETFLRAWRQAPDWTPGAALFSTWLHRVAVNLCLDRLRRRRPTEGEDAAAELADPGPSPAAGLFQAERARRVEHALQALPERQRAAIVLCHYQELGNIEAAEVLQISVEALESLLSRGRRALRASLADLVREDA